MNSAVYTNPNATVCEVAPNLENSLDGTCMALRDAIGVLDSIDTILDGPKPTPEGQVDPQHKPSLTLLAGMANEGANHIRERLINLRNRLGN